MSKLQVDSIYAQDGVNAPDLPAGLTVTGIATATSFKGDGSALTGIDATALKDSGGSAYTTGVTVNGTAGQAGANVVIAVPTTGTMPARYYCTTHGNVMGNTIATQTNDIATVADSTTINNIQTVVNNLSTISGKATVDEATALAIALGG